MHTPPPSQSAFLIPRLAIAAALVCAAISLSWFAFAVPTPASGTLTPGTTLTFTTGPNLRSNPTAQVGLMCDATFPCEDYALTVNVPAGYEQNFNLVITTSFPTPGEDYDVYLYQGTTSIKDSASSSNPEVIIADALAGSYTVRVVPFTVAGGTTTTTIELRAKPVTPTPPPPGSGTPRYQIFPAPAGLGESSGEPTLGAGKPSASQPGGPTLFIAGLETLRVTWDDCSSPAKPLWEDKSFITTSATTLDPILFTDLGAGRLSPARLFVSQLGPKTSSLAYSDDNGETYLQSQGSPINPGVDHQTVGGGPLNNNAVPPPPPHLLYPNAIYYASQDIAVAQLGRSDDGSQTFGPAIPMYNLTQCGGLHGHIKVAPDGTVYVPNKGCGGQQAAVVSQDNGITFAIRPVPGSSPGASDPSIGVDAAGKIYFAFADGDGHPKVSVSSDRGVTWSATPTDVGVPFGLKNTVFPTAVGGSAGRATVMYLASDAAGNGSAAGFTGVWHIYAASTFDGGLSWTTVRVTPENDPVQRGSVCTSGTTCGADRNLLDFNDMEIDHEGRVIMGFADGCIGCTSPTGADSRSAKATIARQSGGKRMLAQFDPNPAEPAVPAAPRVDSVVRDGNGIVHLAWAAPDNGGSAVTGYNVFRKEGAAGTYVRLGGATPPTVPANRTTYDDATASPTAQYFYKVTALNAIGEGTFCREFSVGNAPPSANRCILPGIPLLADPVGDETGDPANAQRDITEVSVAELFNPNSTVNRATLRLKVANLTPTPLPLTRWTIFFTRQDPAPATTSTEWFVAMVTDDTASPGTPVYRYGHTTIGTGGVRQLATDGTADSGTNTPDGTILISIGQPTTSASGRAFPPIQTGESFTLVNAITQQSGGVLLATTDSTGNAQYTIAGNSSCQPNTAPVAVLAANPQTGIAPVTVNFDASGSSDPDSGDTITSYTFNYGDGVTEVKTVPTASHLYADSGVYNATVRVTDSHNGVSNTAGSVIQVATTLSGIASRKTHGKGGPVFDIPLPTSGPVGVECRNDGSNSHTIVFTFQRDLTTVTSSAVTEGTATKNGEGVGPNTNQYFVNVTGAPNAQFVTVTLNGVKDSAGANLTGVRGRMAILNGDTTANLSVNSSDIGQTKATSGQPANSANFRLDVNANGQINSSDISQIKAQSGTSVP